MTPASNDRRRLRSSNPSGRPRKVAGQRPTPEDPQDPVVESEIETPEVEGEPDPAVEPEPGPVVEPVETPEAPEAPAEPETPEEPSRPRVNRLLVALVAAVVVFVLVAVAEIFYLAHDPEASVSSSRPVVSGDVTTRAAVDAAARATEQILSTSYQDYDNQVDQAASKMTDTFAEQYRSTAEGLADKYAAEKMKITVKAVDQGVAQASGDEVQALLFLNQYVEKVDNGEPKTGVAQYRAMVTVVHTDHGWLVSNIETQ